MKFDCQRSHLFDAVTLAHIAASSRTPLAILQNLRLEAAGNQLIVLGCDGEMWVQRSVPCFVHEEGSVCLQGRLLFDIVKSLPEGDCTLTVNAQGSALLQEGNSEYRMMALSAEDFPPMPDTGSEATLTIPMQTFRSAVDSVAYAVATDSHRPVLTGVLMRYDGESLTMVATDTHRLAHRKISGEGWGAEVGAIVPEKALRAIAKMPIPDDQAVTIRFGDQRLGVSADGAEMVCQLLPEPYPNWERVVPQEFTRTWTVEVDQLREKVNRVMIIARESANRVKFSGKANEVVVSSRSEEKGDAKEELPMIGTGGDLDIAFNGEYVRDAVKPITGAGARIELTESSRPAVIRSVDDDSYFCVIMPMALG
ncbi:MAG: DNA polymerase III subunit beta [Fimbriimonadaceae bacterium]|nr:DNA polymerase III subunit beta [Fimbriimonadaceae bacterium]